MESCAVSRPQALGCSFLCPSCQINVQPSVWLQGTDLIPSQRFQETINTLPTPFLAFCPYFLPRAGICSPLWVRADFHRPRWQLLELCWPQRHVGRTEGEAATWRPCLKHFPWPRGELWPASCPAGAIQLFFYLPLERLHAHRRAAWGGPGRTLPPQGGAAATQCSLLGALEASRAGRGQAMEEEVGAVGGLHPPQGPGGRIPEIPRTPLTRGRPSGSPRGRARSRCGCRSPRGWEPRGRLSPAAASPSLGAPRGAAGVCWDVLEEPRRGWVERWLQGARRSPRGWIRARCRQRCIVKAGAFIQKVFLAFEKGKKNRVKAGRCHHLVAHPRMHEGGMRPNCFMG